jgi:CRISPR-associated protein Cas1
MGTLLVDGADVELRTAGDALVVHRADQRRGSIPMRLLERVVIQGDVRLSASVLTRLAEAGVATLLLSRRHARRIAIVLGPAHNDVAIRLGQATLAFDPAWVDAWSRRIVQRKLRGQAATLRTALGARPDCRKPLFDAIGRLEQALFTLSERQPAGDRIRGIEGAAARSYFAGLASVMPPSLGFTGRNRRPPRDPVNAMLSLGYTLVHFEAVRAAHSAGLDPLVGFLHRPAFGRESLASDLLEVARPRIDAWVWDLVRSRRLRGDHFARDGRACMLGKAGRGVYFAEYERAAGPWRRLLRRQCRVLVRHVRRRGESLVGDDLEIDEPGVDTADAATPTPDTFVAAGTPDDGGKIEWN